LEELTREVTPNTSVKRELQAMAQEQKDRKVPETENAIAMTDTPAAQGHYDTAEKPDILAEQGHYHVDKKPEASLKEPVKYAKQETLFDRGILSEQAQKEVKIIGQVFATYWILQYEDKMYLVDQHAAHEKVLYERFMKELQEKEPMTQLLQPPVIVSLSMVQQQAVEENQEIFRRLGYQIEPFGGREYAVSGVPAHLPAVGTQELLVEIIDSLCEEQGRVRAPEILLDKVASMSCKAAVKGNSKLPPEQMEELLRELMTLENPYHCPHGRPTMISMTKTELEKRFKRIV
jgi:DNA mismatch repair protein MutL